MSNYSINILAMSHAWIMDIDDAQLTVHLRRPGIIPIYIGRHMLTASPEPAAALHLRLFPRPSAAGPPRTAGLCPAGPPCGVLDVCRRLTLLAGPASPKRPATGAGTRAPLAI